MKTSSELIVLVVITFLLYTRPIVLVNFSNSFVGKAILLFLIISAALHSTVTGLLMALVLVMLTEYNYEGFEGKDDSESDNEDADADSSDSVNDFRKKNCKATDGSDKEVFVDANGNEMDLDEIKKKYPNINFDKGDCNPCSADCSFSISDSEEQITTDEALRPKDSSEMPASRPNVGSS
jgi:hypothetical protein|tara:strand:+ start:1193 stop:1732 length:540 start_codon:yes stop_codon:yes gene_type:complete